LDNSPISIPKEVKTILIKPKAIIWLVPALLIGISFSSCNKKDDIGNIVSPASGYVTFINAAQGTATQDFFVDNIKINNTGLAYAESTGYVEIKTGGHQLQVKSSVNSILNHTSTFSVTAPYYYSIFYADDKSTLLVDDNRATPKAGKCRVRFVNLSSAIGNVDIGIKGGAKIVSGLDYKTYSGYYDLDPGTAFFIYQGGSNVILKNIPVVLEMGHLYAIYFTGTSSSAVKYQLLTLD
jgi:hypothetical protein